MKKLHLQGYKMNGLSTIGAFFVGLKHVVGLLAIAYLFCKIRLNYYLRIFFIFLAFSGSISMGTLYITHAQDDYHERLSPVDRAQEQHLHWLDEKTDKTNEDRADRRKETEEFHAKVQSAIDDLKERNNANSEKISNIYAYGGAFAFLLGAINTWIGFISKKPDLARDQRDRYRDQRDLERDERDNRR